MLANIRETNKNIYEEDLPSYLSSLDELLSSVNINFKKKDK